MSVLMNNISENSSEIDKEEQVKKLQELVKTLELQNEELRSERHALLLNSKNKIAGNCDEVEKAENETKQAVDLKEKSIQYSLESLPMDASCRLSFALDDKGISDEETWLFDSPYASKKGEWLDNDIKESSLNAAKKSLLKQLDEIESSPKHSPRHSLYSPSSSSGLLSPESPTSNQGEIDSRTFLRPRKRKPLSHENTIDERGGFALKDPPNHLMGGHNRPKEYIVRSNGSLGSEDDDRMSSASDGSYSSFRLTDVEDVNAVARLQEESLKFPDPRTRNRIPDMLSRSAVASQQRVGSSGNSTASSQEDLLSSPPPGQQHITPGRARGSRSSLPGPSIGRYASPGTFMPKSRESSDMSTPPESPYTSQQNLQAYNGRTLGSRLPNMTRRLGGSDPRLLDMAPASSHSVLSARQIATIPDNQNEGRISRLQAPQTRTSRLSAPSPVRIPLKGPTQVPHQDASRARQATSALPQPGSRLQAPKSRTMSQSPLKYSAAKSDWREGCY